MRLYSSKVPAMAHDIVELLVRDGDIECADQKEVELDVESVLKEYIRMERELSDRVRDVLSIRGLSYTNFGKIKHELAAEQDLPLGEEAVRWLSDQILEMMMRSPNVEEIFSEDIVLRRKMENVILKWMKMDDMVEEEVRRRMKHVEEGSATWDIEYKRTLEEIRRKYGMD